MVVCSNSGHVPTKKMRGEVSTYLVVNASAKDVWAVFRSPDLPRIVPNLIPGVFKEIKILKGDGGVGSVLRNVLAKGIPGPRSWEEKIVMIDNVKRMKRIRMTKGGFLDLGFRSYENFFKIIEKGTKSCMIKSAVIFKADEDKFESNAFRIRVDATWGFSKAIAFYVVQKNKK
ncbi:hypothetical protein GIB67_017438 [Kingdonia uniflora]|uniref:Bet v I/Major latex protein domain-containing protein n=1 Tax=Kingdonia uniflora TaxID=39325 RepID=A0A7J7M4B2_9MAGN|nr:hypothetical protein GIB67_017438 [Kingdonia uniflora]